MRDPLADPAPLIRRVYAYVAYRLGDGPEAEDVTSETFERALRYVHSFDPRRGEVSGWLIGIARRCIADRGLRPALQLVDVPERTTESHEDSVLRRLELRAAVTRLHPRDAELLALRFGADLTAAQIGALLGMKTNAVEVALHRTLARLRDELQSRDADGLRVTAPVRV